VVIGSVLDVLRMTSGRNRLGDVMLRSRNLRDAESSLPDESTVSDVCEVRASVGSSGPRVTPRRAGVPSRGVGPLS